MKNESTEKTARRAIRRPSRDEAEQLADALAGVPILEPKKRGPKFKSPDRLRTERVYVSLTPAELDEIAAVVDGESIAVGIRSLALQKAREITLRTNKPF